MSLWLRLFIGVGAWYIARGPIMVPCVGRGSLWEVGEYDQDVSKEDFVMWELRGAIVRGGDGRCEVVLLGCIYWGFVGMLSRL
ncbi:hypothetical protein HNY73_003393 [Argiope bruennichi]|uniref:Uncharacterized protein n=1 Tax=Argiope bruennichi TaxID=94029 RepID=A0A8T0FQF4_ARGBR|nr:hypothetical protein HNY73_003393 [Argiope bruennichi]